MKHFPETIGFVGFGLMGHGMARNIALKGYPLAVANGGSGPTDDVPHLPDFIARANGMK